MECYTGALKVPMAMSLSCAASVIEIIAQIIQLYTVTTNLTTSGDCP